LHVIDILLYDRDNFIPIVMVVAETLLRGKIGLDFILVYDAIEYFTILFLNQLSLSQLRLASGGEERQFVHLLPDLVNVSLVVSIKRRVKYQPDTSGLQRVFP
jgi:hypothetical protein